jgi:hypothetical protein
MLVLRKMLGGPWGSGGAIPKQVSSGERYSQSYEFKLSFNTVMLDVVSFSFLPEENLPVGNLVVNDASGVVSVNAFFEGTPITTSNGVPLVSITFKMMKGGRSPLHLYDTKMLNSGNNPISHVTADGMVLILRRDVAIVDVVPSTTETYVGRIVNVKVIATRAQHTDPYTIGFRFRFEAGDNWIQL